MQPSHANGLRSTSVSGFAETHLGDATDFQWPPLATAGSADLGRDAWEYKR
jgi:hypothetical protein